MDEAGRITVTYSAIKKILNFNESTQWASARQRATVFSSAETNKAEI